MKALLSAEPGGPETLVMRDLPIRQAGPGHLRVRVLACGINYPDAMMIEDRYQFKPPRPFSPGTEIAGVIEEVGEGVTGWRQGDRIVAPVQYGGLSEQMLVSAGDAFRLPGGKSAVEAAALIFTYATSFHALVDRGRLRSGETLLVLGAAGGVGLAAVEIGHALGARVVAGASSAEKAAVAAEAGADATFVYGRGPFDKEQGRALTDAIRQAVGTGGADVIYDPVGGAYTESALRNVAVEGRHLVVGFVAGVPGPPLNLALLKSAELIGVFWGPFVRRYPARNAANVEQLFVWWAEGRIRPRIDHVYAFEHGGQAIARLAERSVMGKVVVRVADDG